MAHNLFSKDNMIAVGQTPWHGLGTTLSEPPDSAREALQLAGLNWTVTKQQMFLADGRLVKQTDEATKVKEGNHGAIVRDDTGDVLGVVGPDYRPFQNTQMSDLFEPLVRDKTLTIETCGSLFNGRRVWMLGKFGQDTVIDTNDTVAKYMLLAHGHDGSFAVRFGFTPIRVVCHNTLSAATNGGESKLIRCLHTSGLQKNLETLRSAMQQGEEVFNLTADQFRKLAQRGVSRVDLREFARIVVDAPAEFHKWTNAEKSKVAAITENATHGKGNRGSNWWHAYNGVTEYVCWQAGRSADRRLSESWWGSGREMSQKALTTALQMSGIA